MRFSTPLLTAIVAALLTPSISMAECPEMFDQVLFFPVDGATNVPTNVVLRLELPQGSGTIEPHWIVLDEDNDHVEGETYWDGLTSSFTPDEPLSPHETYTYDNDHIRISFTTGDGPDDSRPRFDGVTAISWDYKTAEWLQESCNQYRGGGHLFTLSLGEVNDTIDPVELCYHIYRSEGPDLSGPRLEARTRILDNSLTLFVPEGAGDGHYCFHAEVQDLAGRFDTNTNEVCADVIGNALFGNICSVAAPSTRTTTEGLLVATCLVLLVAGRRLRRYWG